MEEASVETEQQHVPIVLGKNNVLCLAVYWDRSIKGEVFPNFKGNVLILVLSDEECEVEVVGPGSQRVVVDGDG